MRKKGKRKRPAPCHADLLLFEGGFQTTEQERGDVPTFAPWDRYFQERTPEAFGIRYLLVTTNIIQVTFIMSIKKIGFIKNIVNAVCYGC